MRNPISYLNNKPFSPLFVVGDRVVVSNANGRTITWMGRGKIVATHVHEKRGGISISYKVLFPTTGEEFQFPEISLVLSHLE